MPDRQHLDEVSLVELARKGDAQAFGELYELYAPRVYRFLNGHLNDGLDAEDMTEDVFLRTWQFLPNFRERGLPFSSFLFRVARNALIDHYRRSGRRRGNLDLDEDKVADPEANPASVFANGSERREVRLVLGRLREDYSTVLSLRFLAGLSPAETAKVMGRSQGAVRVLQHRALAAARKILKKME